MFKYEIISLPSFQINNDILHKILFSISDTIELPQNGILNIVFVGNEQIQKLNNDYRGKDSVTDVLSFHYYDDFSDIDEQEVAGEIILNESKIIAQATEYGLGNEKEFYKLLIHSTLHILGYDHEQDNDYKIMQDKEDTIWQEVFEK